MRPTLPLLMLLAAVPPAAAADTPRDGDWEAAIGLVADYAPEYSGAAKHKLGVEPVVYLRWKRLSLSSGGGFVNRRNDAAPRGLGLNLVRGDEWQLDLGLRYDRGRDDTDSGAFAGLGDIRATVRVRAGATWRPKATAWRFGSSWSVDAAGRGGGWFGDVSAAHEWRQASGTAQGRTWTAGVALTAGSARYLQNHYGVTPQQATRTGYPAYTPGGGLRDGALFANLRWSLSTHWALTAGAGITRTLGPARASPLVARATAAAASFGAAYSF